MSKVDVFFYKNNEYTHIARIDNCVGDVQTVSENACVVIGSDKEIPSEPLDTKEMDNWLKIEPIYGINMLVCDPEDY